MKKTKNAIHVFEDFYATRSVLKTSFSLNWPYCILNILTIKFIIHIVIYFYLKSNSLWFVIYLLWWDCMCDNRYCLLFLWLLFLSKYFSKKILWSPTNRHFTDNQPTRTGNSKLFWCQEWDTYSFPNFCSLQNVSLIISKWYFKGWYTFNVEL